MERRTPKKVQIEGKEQEIGGNADPAGQEPQGAPKATADIGVEAASGGEADRQLADADREQQRGDHRQGDGEREGASGIGDAGTQAEGDGDPRSNEGDGLDEHAHEPDGVGA